MKGMAEVYDPLMMDITRICTKSWEAFTSEHSDRHQKFAGILSPRDVADLTELYDRNMGKNSQDEDVTDLLSLINKLTLDEQSQVFIYSDIASTTTNDLCKCLDIESNINVK